MAVYSFADVELDTSHRVIRRGGEVVDVEPQVFDVIQLLVENHDRMLTREEILDEVWGDRFVSMSTLSSRIKTARRAVGDNGRDQRIVRTVHGRGFRFLADVKMHGRPGAKVVTTAAETELEASAGEQIERTFVFSDIAGSTRRWERYGEAMGQALRCHDEIVQRQIEAHGGTVFKHTGDGMAAAFDDPGDAVLAAVAVQAEIQAADWSDVDGLMIRMSVHVGPAAIEGADYVGHGVSFAGRLLSVANAGQIVASDEVAAALEGRETHGHLHAAGAYNLQDLGEHVVLHLVEGAGFASDRRPLRAEIGVNTNLSRRRVELVGREAELLAVLDRVAANDLVSIVGPGGVGKTSLAIEAGHRLLASHTGGVWLCELASASSPEVPAAVIGAIDGIAGGGVSSAADVVERLPDAPAVLILDNCEHVIDAAAKLAEELVGASSALTILATSREALDLSGEHILRIDGLDHGDTDSAAVELFIERAREMTELADEAANREIIRSITGRLEGLPLAIELAVPRLVSMTPAELLAALDDQLSLLESRRRHGSRQGAMDRAIAWSFDLLTGEEQATLAALSVFSGSFTGDAADAVVQSPFVRAILHRLVEQSMVSSAQFGEVTRYRLLEPIRQFVDRRLGSDERARLSEAHARYFATRVSSLALEMRTADEPQSAEHLNAEWSDFGRALAWGREHRVHEVAIDPLLALGFHLHWQLRREGFDWLAAAVEEFGFREGRSAEVDLIRALGAWTRGEQERSIELLDSAVSMAGETVATMLMGSYQSIVSDDPERLTHHTERGWELAEESDDPTQLMVAAALRLVGRVLRDPWGPGVDEAAAGVDRLIETIDWPTGHCFGLLSHVTKCVRQGNTDEALRFRAELERVVRECHAPWFSQIAGSLTVRLGASSIDPVEQLEASTRSVRAAISARDVAHYQLVFRAVVTGLEATDQLESAAQIIGLMDEMGEIGSILRHLSVDYEESAARVRDRLGEEEYRKQVAAGRRLTPEQAADIAQEALEAVLSSR